MRTQYGVIGLGEFGKAVALTLSQLGGEVLAIDIDSHKVEEIKDHVISAVTLDVTDEKALKASGMGNVDVAVVAVGEHVEVSILVTALLKKIGVPKIISKAHSDLHADILKIVGAGSVIDPEVEMGKKLAREIIKPSLMARIPISTGHEIIEIETPELFFNKSLEELQLRPKYNLNLIAIKKRVREVNENGEIYCKYIPNRSPKASDKINEGDILVFLGEEEAIKNFLDKV
jgi:trk system potassium uptake protein TrkA